MSTARTRDLLPDRQPESAAKSRYTAQERRARILDKLETTDFISVKELAASFDVTEMSLRRDLAALADEGRLTRVRGGATRARTSSVSPLYADARTRNAEAKSRIASAAAAMIEPGTVVFFYSGSTVAKVPAYLPAEVRASITMATNSLPILDEVRSWTDPHLVVVGGLYLPSYMTFVGPQAVAVIKELSADVAMVGCDGLSASGGLTTPHQLVAEVGAAMIERARRTIVVADSSKIGRCGFTPISPVDAVDVLVTDRDADDREVAALRDIGLEVMIV